MKAAHFLLDGGFIAALLDVGDPLHASAEAEYGMLVDDYERGEVRLFAPSTVLRGYGRDVRRGVLAPVETTWVSWQHRIAARRITGPADEIALILVLLRHERFAGLATTSRFYEQFDLHVIRASVGGSELDDRVPPGSVTFETEPLPALRSTDG